MQAKFSRLSPPFGSTLSTRSAVEVRDRSGKSDGAVRSLATEGVGTNPMHRPFPDPWLFDSEALLRELDRCREKVLEIPVNTHAAYFASDIAVRAIWNLRERLRELLLLHRQGQDAFALRANHAQARRAQEASDHKQHELRGKALALARRKNKALWIEIGKRKFGDVPRSRKGKAAA